jgi:transcriptional regulator with XRE-family HTH domain
MAINIGFKIKEIAESKNLSQEDLGKLINKTKQNVGDIYKRESVDTELLLKLCEVLKFDFFDLLYEEEPLKGIRNNLLSLKAKEIHDLKEDISRKDLRIKDLEETISAQKKLIVVLEKNS